MPYSPRSSGPQSSSSSPRRRVYWIIVDGLGYRIADLAMQRGSFTSLDRIRSEGYLGPLDPDPPNCQTPPALWALFSGLGSTESGIWGYNAPNYQGRLSESVSGFALRPKAGVPIWAELERLGVRYSLVNAAFRHDPVWTEEYRHFDLVFDGYRNMSSGWMARSLPSEADQRRIGMQGFRFLGTKLNAARHGAQVQVHRRGRLLATAGPGETADLQVGEAVEATLFHAGDGNLFLFPHYEPYVRLMRGKGEGGDEIGDALAIPERLIDGNIFRQVRAAAEAASGGRVAAADTASGDRQVSGSIPVGGEMRIGEEALDDVVNVSLAAADLGIAFGAPTALAADAADVVIPGDRLERIFTAFELIGTTRRRVRQNLGWALLYNAVAIPLAVSGHLNPLFAAVAMSASSLLVVWNSARPIASLGLASPAAGLDQDRAKVLMRLGSPK